MSSIFDPFSIQTRCTSSMSSCGYVARLQWVADEYVKEGSFTIAEIRVEDVSRAWLWITINSLLQQDIRVVLPKCIEKDIPESIMTLDTVRAVGTS